MSAIVGLGSGSPWAALVRRVPAATILAYVHDQWQAFATECSVAGVSLQTWKETELTKALQAKLSKAACAGCQPFDGDFIAEHETFDIDPKTFKPVCISRTDIEWILAGFPRFTIEFKILDGGPQLRTRYWRDGLRKFVTAIYAPRASEAAMWAFLRSGGYADGPKVGMLLQKRAVQLASVQPQNPLTQPSILATGLGLFDTSHIRANGPSPLMLTHLFVALP